MIWCIKAYIIAYVKIQKKNKMYYPLCHGFWSSGESSTRAFQGDEWVTPDVGNRRQEKILHAAVSYFQEYLWVSTSHCQYEEAEGQMFHPAHAGKYGYKAVTIGSDDTDIFVMSLMF